MSWYGDVEPLTDEQKKWQSESDARTLAEAEAIKTDEDRMTAATEVAKKMAPMIQAEAHGMATVAGSLKYDKM